MRTTIAMLWIALLLAGCGGGMNTDRMAHELATMDLDLPTFNWDEGVLHGCRHVYDGKCYLKPIGTRAAESVTTFVIAHDLDEALRQIEERPAGFYGVHERIWGAAARLTSALADVGLYYEVVSASPAYPILDETGVMSQGRTVIVARSDDEAFAIGNPQAGTFAAADTGPGGVALTRGWASVDADSQVRHLRIIAADLTTPYPALRAAWYDELASGPAATDREVLFGDGDRAAPRRGAR